MQIIKEGTLWYLNKTFRCTACKCEFKVEKNDNITVYVDRIYVSCPSCSAFLDIKPHQRERLNTEKETALPRDTKEADSLFDAVFGRKGLFEKIFGK